MSEGIRVADFVYANRGSTALQGRLYLPDVAPPRGFAVQVHGGGWCSGDRLQDAAICEALVREGIALFAIDFRMPPEAAYPAAVDDVAAALGWLRDKVAAEGGDANGVGLIGMSSGGHLAALCALDAEGAFGPCAFWVGCWPVVDPHARFAMARERARDDLVRNHLAFWADEAEMLRGSPQRLVETGAYRSLPPALLLQGLADDNVDPEMTARFAAAYRAAGGAVELQTFAEQPHAFIKRNPTSAASRQATAAIVDFIVRHSA